ncbi:MAG: hypothetical protein ACLQBD_13840 [Syntrophobacteraceae bacterium]
MESKKIILAIVFAAITATAGVVYAEPPGPRPPDHDMIGHLSIQDRAPAFSSPEVKMAPNGDRESHYSPYYHPERD